VSSDKMQLDVELSSLNAALRRVRPALRDAADGQHVLRLGAAPHELRLLATGRTLTISTTVEASAEDSWQITVPARLLTDIAFKGLDARASLSVRRGDLYFTCGGLTAELRGQPGLPPAAIQVSGNAEVATLTADECRRAAAITFACSTNAARPLLTGVHLHPGVAEATDSYRIARTALSGWTFDAVLPADLLALAAHVNEQIRAAFDGRVIRLSGACTTWTGPVLLGPFPPLDRYLREPVRERLTCDRSALAHAVSVAAAIPGAFVDLVGAVDRILIRSESPQMGAIRSDVTTASTLNTTRSFTAAYLSDALSAAVGDEVTIEFTDRAAIIRCAAFEQFVLLRADSGTAP